MTKYSCVLKSAKRINRLSRSREESRSLQHSTWVQRTVAPRQYNFFAPNGFGAILTKHQRWNKKNFTSLPLTAALNTKKQRKQSCMFQATLAAVSQKWHCNNVWGGGIRLNKRGTRVLSHFRLCSTFFSSKTLKINASQKPFYRRKKYIIK